MEAKELRIGNYVELLGHVVEIECISRLPMLNEMYWLKCKKYVDTKIIHFKPIPLTEEWLIKFGFYYSDDENEFLELKLMHNVKLYADYSNNFSTAILRIKENEVKIKHVHQLQNLFFVLTGEELEIKI